MYKLEDYLTPIWMGNQVFRETFTMIEENGVCSAPFLYRPGEIIKVESYDGSQVYEKGRDWYVKDGSLILTPESRILRTGWDGIYYYHKADAEDELKTLPPGFGLPVIATNDGRYIRLSVIAHPWLLYQWQIAVTYTTKERWRGYKPQSKIARLPHLYSKLLQKKPVKVVLYGDSISYGYDCTGIYGVEPNQPKWANLVCESLSKRFDTKVTLVNASASGENSDWAFEHAKELVVSEAPDLVILGFGMNDRCPKDEYRQKTARIKNEILKYLPEAEFILIATSIPNTLLDTEPLRFYAYQDTYAKALKHLCKEDCVLANIQDVQRVIMKRKRYIDLAGNNINHPNDFFARIHAQVIDALLTPET